jgi:apolipoprotein N-acyltransferase
MRGCAYSPSVRMAAGLLQALSRIGALALLVALLFFDTRLDNQLRLMRAFAILVLLPGFAAWVVMRSARAVVVVERGCLVLDHGARRIEVPCESVAGVAPWSVPLPAAGSWLDLESGRRFGYGLAVDDPALLLDSLVECGAAERIRDVVRHPSMVYAGDVATWPASASHLILKFPVFALAAAIPLFRLHQWITYGGTFGEYYAYGLGSYLLAFGIYWATATLWLVLIDAALRAAVEAVALVAARFAPRTSRGVRRAAEITYRFLYYGSVPLFLGRLLLLSQT